MESIGIKDTHKQNQSKSGITDHRLFFIFQETDSIICTKKLRSWKVTYYCLSN